MSEAIVAEIRKLTEAVVRQTTVLESLVPPILELAHSPDPSYQGHMTDDRLLDEDDMAKVLEIPKRTLAEYRRDGRFPGCWVRNQRRIWWYPDQARAAWAKGIA